MQGPVDQKSRQAPSSLVLGSPACRKTTLGGWLSAAELSPSVPLQAATVAPAKWVKESGTTLDASGMRD